MEKLPTIARIRSEFETFNRFSATYNHPLRTLRVLNLTFDRAAVDIFGVPTIYLGNNSGSLTIRHIQSARILGDGEYSIMCTDHSGEIPVQEQVLIRAWKEFEPVP